MVATRGSIIYFVIAGLSNVDPMYQYSLKFYKDLFTQRLQRAEKHEEVQQRLRQGEFTYGVALGLGIFASERLLQRALSVDSAPFERSSLHQASRRQCAINSCRVDVPEVPGLRRDNVYVGYRSVHLFCLPLFIRM